jgi:hypothetical protein
MEKREALKKTLAESADELAEIDGIIDRMQGSLGDDDAKPSAADLTRLLELKREMAYSRPGPIVARWIDECRQTYGE